MNQKHHQRMILLIMPLQTMVDSEVLHYRLCTPIFLSLSHTHTHTHSLSLSLTHTHSLCNMALACVYMCTAHPTFGCSCCYLPCTNRQCSHRCLVERHGRRWCVERILLHTCHAHCRVRACACLRQLQSLTTFGVVYCAISCITLGGRLLRGHNTVLCGVLECCRKLLRHRCVPLNMGR